ncbi:MAG: M42 family metallopeptidase [Planctomycetota bacterium]
MAKSNQKKQTKRTATIDGEPRRFLERLLSVPSPVGSETAVRAVIADYARAFADNVQIDTMGNLTAVINPDARPRVMLVGHSDEIGLLVNYIEDDGYLRVAALGGVDISTYLGYPVDILTRDGTVRGVIGSRPIHLQTAAERDAAPTIKTIWIDIGATSKDDASKRVRIGDPAVVSTGFNVLRDNICVARGFDNRAGVWVAFEALRQLKASGSKACVYAVASAQEEIGARGAIPAAYRLDCDYGVAIDVTFATDYPSENTTEQGDVCIGGGPVIARGPVLDDAFADQLLQTAAKHRIPYQTEATSRSTGTDADYLQISRGGMRTALVSVPVRYMHTPVETLNIGDMAFAAELLAAAISNI